jgi:hypothetical protein
MPESFEVSPQFLEVIDLPVVREDYFSAAVRHRLVPGGREVDYRKPPVAQPYSTGRELTYVDSLVIGAPMSYARQHLLDESLVRVADYSTYSAHNLSGTERFYVASAQAHAR